MNNLLKIFTLLLFVGMATIATAQEKSLPSVDIKYLDGKSVDIQDFATNGKITVVSFWATWCSPCKKELDAIADL